MAKDQTTDMRELAAENEALRRELEETRAALAAANEAQTLAAKRSSFLKKANDLLDRQLFHSTLSHEIVKVAEAGEDLKKLCEQLFILVGRLVRMEKVGVRLHRQGHTSFYLHPKDDAALLGMLEAIAGGREVAVAPPEAVFTYRLGRAEAPFGLFVCLGPDAPFTPQDREILVAICQQASPILEHNLLIRLLQELSGFQEDFVAMLSHDLRNPLTGVMSSLSTLLIPGLPLSEADREGLVHTALDSARMVNEMIGDLLDVAKLEAGRMHIDVDAVDLLELVETAIHTMQPMADAKRLALTLEAPDALPPVRGDERKLLRVFINLISNALKYTQKGGVVVRLTARPGQVEAAVSDTGFGIPPEAQGRLFEKFYQVADRRRGKVGGTGLGLAYCRQMVEAHSGAIWVESPSAEAARVFPLPAGFEPAGTTFRLTLPAS